jgi:putative transposase
VFRYIEANPLRARMVTGLAEYPWSSFAAHARGHVDPLLLALPGWERIGADERKRAAFWRE